MPNRILEWEVLSDADGEQRDAANKEVTPVAHSTKLQLSHLATMTLVALVVIGSGGYILWRQAQAGLVRLDSELALAVEAKEWRTKLETDKASRVMTNPAHPYLSPARNERPTLIEWDKINKEPEPTGPRHDLGTPPELRVDNVEIREMVGGIAMVEVTTVDEAGRAYRETQFYLDEQGYGWQLSFPDVSFWGPEQSSETAHFDRHYHERDAAAVAAVKPILDGLYLQIRHDLGLSPPSPKGKLIIEVKAAAFHLPPADYAGNRLVTLSPLLVVAPADMSQVEVLHAEILSLLIQRTLYLAQERQPIWCIWRPLLDGLVQWQMRLHGATTLGGSEKPSQNSPSLKLLLNSDKNCLERPVTFLAARPDNPTSAAMAETLFAYVVDRYGREGVPTLLSAFRHYSTWEDAIPAAFATSANAFEAGWQAFVLNTSGRSAQ